MKYVLQMSSEGCNITSHMNEEVVIDASDLPEDPDERDEWCEEYTREWFFNWHSYGWNLEEVPDETTQPDN